MKKFNLIPVALILLITLTVSSCNKEIPLEDAIIGTWEVQERTVLVLENNIKQESYTEFLEANEEVFQFVEGGSGIFYEFSDNYLFSWTLVNSTLSIIDLFDYTLQSEAIVDGDILIFSYEETDDEDPNVKYIFSRKAYRKN
jgi:hypothetical protein